MVKALPLRPAYGRLRLVSESLFFFESLLQWFLQLLHRS